MTAPPKKPSTQEGLFWKTKTLEQMSEVEWESLCDGCARCCLEKLEDEDTGKIYFTHVSCRLLDAGLCACRDYANRSEQVPDCVRLTPANVRTLNWLPPSCAYRLVAEGRDLFWWHPLISGDPNTVHEAGVSVRGRNCGRRPRRPHRELAGDIAEAGALKEASRILKVFQARCVRGTHPCASAAAAAAIRCLNSDRSQNDQIPASGALSDSA
jgi:uncharacterized protein